MQLGAKRAVDARATLLLGRGWCKTQNAHEARPRPSFRGQKAVSHVVWTQIPSTVLPPGPMAKCQNCDSVHWQRQQSSVQVREPETGVEKVKRKWLQRTGPQVYVAEEQDTDGNSLNTSAKSQVGCCSLTSLKPSLLLFSKVLELVRAASANLRPSERLLMSSAGSFQSY